MQSITGSIWTLPGADAICIPTNGMLNGGRPQRAAMGSGVADDARLRYPGIDIVLADKLRAGGNQCHILLWDHGRAIVSFPTKWDWRDKSDRTLIRSSCLQLAYLADEEGWLKVALPKIGSGLGKLNWETDVRPIVEPLLDDRFWIVALEPGGAARSAGTTGGRQPAGRKENPQAVGNDASEPQAQDSAERHYGIN